jgi:hypothetical protein
MTERRARPGGPGWTAVVAGSLALFLVLVLLLGVQMRAGRDPALGAGKPAAQTAAGPARPMTVVHRIVTRRVVRTVHDDDAPAAPPPAPGPPVTTSAAPAPAPAPAPPPPPAPVVTRSS